jgi:hypothetical protein
MSTSDLYQLLSDARGKCSQYPTDNFAPTVLGITTGLIHPDSVYGRATDPAALYEWYNDLAEQLALEAAEAVATPLSDACLAICARLELSVDRGIIREMTPPPNPTTKPPASPKTEEQVDTVRESLRDWRIGCFEELKFTPKEAEKLADAKTVDYVKNPKTGELKRYESPLHHGKARKLLEQGVNHKQIVNLLT